MYTKANTTLDPLRMMLATCNLERAMAVTLSQGQVAV